MGCGASANKTSTADAASAETPALPPSEEKNLDPAPQAAAAEVLYVGTWELQYANGFTNVYAINESGRLDVLGAYDGAGTAKLEPVSAESLKE
eukprot:CAMPEP_0168456874 /NCGR_PEP_ID=MMETSP0228-20121227/51532_1 /TAXON_ID=133427 /ORGANISM="Protoceratium reticulatum, Strain CCCM 535 (=CCMP 1889)" /LENGTH=92 /DNA_ID=CAMNT_0008471847 /DNA_START=16 /DNA_END=291 /DNA_ORIENTATION=+